MLASRNLLRPSLVLHTQQEVKYYRDDDIRNLQRINTIKLTRSDDHKSIHH